MRCINPAKLSFAKQIAEMVPIILACLALFAMASGAEAFGSSAQATWCGSFDKQGVFTSAEVRGREAKLASAGSFEASLKLPFAPTECSVFVSDSGLLAVALRQPTRAKAALHYLLFDPKKREWVSQQPYTVEVAEDSRARIVGFLGDTDKLVAFSSGEYFPQADRSTVFALVFDVFHPAVKTTAFSVAGDVEWQNYVALDLPHSQFWITEYDNERCSIQTVKLNALVEKPAKVRQAQCLRPNLTVGGSGEAMLAVSQDSSGVSLGRFELASGKAQPVLTNRKQFLNRMVTGKVTVSPSGRSIALAYKEVKRGRFGGESIVNGVMVLDSQSLDVIGGIRLSAAPLELAVSDIDGKVSLRELTEKGWQALSIGAENVAKVSQP